MIFGPPKYLKKNRYSIESKNKNSSVIISVKYTPNTVSLKYDDHIVETFATVPIPTYENFFMTWKIPVKKIVTTLNSALILFRDGTVDLYSNAVIEDPQYPPFWKDLRCIIDIAACMNGYAALENKGDAHLWSSFSPFQAGRIVQNTMELHATAETCISVSRDRRLFLWHGARSIPEHLFRCPRVRVQSVCTYPGSRMAAFVFQNETVSSFKDTGFSRDLKTVHGKIRSANKALVNHEGVVVLCKNGYAISWDHSGTLYPVRLGKIVEIAVTDKSFAALCQRGTITTWGSKSYGGISPEIHFEVTQLMGNGGGFLARNRTSFETCVWPLTPHERMLPRDEKCVYVENIESGYLLVDANSNATICGSYEVTHINHATGALYEFDDLPPLYLRDDGMLLSYKESISNDYQTQRAVNISLLGELLKVSYEDGSFQLLQSNPYMKNAVVKYERSDISEVVCVGEKLAVLNRRDDLEFYDIEGDGKFELVATLRDVMKITGNDVGFAYLRKDGIAGSWMSHDPFEFQYHTTAVRRIFPMGDKFFALHEDDSASIWDFTLNRFFASSIIIPLRDVASMHFHNITNQMTIVYIDGSVGTHFFDTSTFELSPNRSLQSLRGAGTVLLNNAGGLVLCDNGYAVSWAPSGRIYTIPRIRTQVKKVVATEDAFAALCNDGAVVSWRNGPMEVPPGLQNIVQLTASDDAFVALREDSTALIWGNGIVESKEDIAQIVCNKDTILMMSKSGSISFYGRPPYGTDSEPGCVIPVQPYDDYDLSAFYLERNGKLIYVEADPDAMVDDTDEDIFGIV